MQGNWKIKEFEDYHEADDWKLKGYRVIEIGCMPSRIFPYSTYFFLVYKGRRPSKFRITQSMKGKVNKTYLLNKRQDFDYEIHNALNEGYN